MMNQLVCAGLMAVGLGGLPGIATADIFLLIPGVNGDSTAKGHEKWIRVSSFDWGVSNTTIIGSATGGATAGKIRGETVKLTIPTGPWSREILHTLARGQHFGQIVIDHLNPDGRPSYRVTIGTFIPTLYRNAPTATTGAQDEIEGVFGTFRAEFYTVGPDGRVLATPVGWNVFTNKEL